jgi:hypothetical protein
MATGVHKKYPPMKETNPGWKGAKSGTKVKQVGNPLGLKKLAGNTTKGGGIFRKPKSN